MGNTGITMMTGFCVINLTKYLMDKYSLDLESAYRKFVNTDFYELLNDPESRLYLETDEYLRTGCMLELEQGKEAMYQFINQEWSGRAG